MIAPDVAENQNPSDSINHNLNLSQTHMISVSRTDTQKTLSSFFFYYLCLILADLSFLFCWAQSRKTQQVERSKSK